MTAPGSDTAVTSPWHKLHDVYLETHLRRLRILAEHRIHWLRSQRWRTEPLDDRAGAGDDRVDRLLARAGQEAPADAAHDVADHAADHDVAESIAAEVERLRQYDTELVALGAPPALTVLARSAGLSPVEADAVLLALAGELDPAFRTLYAYLQDDPNLRCATPGLVADLAGWSLPEAWTLLRADGPLWRLRLLAGADAAGMATPLRLDARIAGFLCGHHAIDERLAGVVEPLADMPLAAPHRALAERLVGWLSDPDRRGSQTVLNLLGAPGQGREALAAAVARALGMVPLRLHPERLAEGGDPERGRLVDRETLLLPGALYADAPTGGADGGAAAGRALETVGGLLLVGSRHRHTGDRPSLAVEVPELAPADRVELWRAAAPEVDASEADLAGLVTEFALGPQGVVHAAAEAAALAELDAGRVGATPTTAHLRAASRTTVGRELGELAQRLRPTRGWEALILPEHQRRLLGEIAGQVAARPRVHDEWGFAARLGRGQGITALFAGPSGTGKTMAAEVIAGELDLELYRIDLSAVISKYIGETEKNLRRVFDAAEQGGVILFFDEADALFGKRTEVKDSHDRHANVEINYLLQRMEDYRGLAILATNRKADLDPAFLRRLRFVVAFPFPRPEYRRRIWQAAFPEETPLAELDYDALAGMELAGGNIHNVAVNAAFLAAGDGEAVTMEHIARAARHEYDKLDRKPSRGELGSHHEAARS